MTIDIDKLRDDLIDYFGSASTIYPITIIDVTKVESASDEEVVKIALENGFDLRDYEIKTHRY